MPEEKAKATKYSRAQYDQMIQLGMLSKEQGEKLIKEGKIVIGSTATYTKKEKEFFSDTHKKWYDSFQAAKAALKPKLEAAVENTPEVAKFLDQYGKLKDAEGDFDVFPTVYWQNALRGDKSFAL